MTGAAVAGTGGMRGDNRPDAQPVLRFVHMTDVHVEPKGRAPDGFAAALRAIEALPDRPDFILNGGDAIFDAIARDREATRAQWRVWHDVLRAETSLPVISCIGNHDPWGWRFRDDPAITGDPLYGKRWAMDELGLEQPYYAFDRAGWRFLILDSTHPGDAEDYTAKLDDPQREWLAGHLADTPATMPVCIVSHIPILSMAAHLWFGADPTPRQRDLIDLLLRHTDGPRIKDLLARHGNVRLCLSGHLHMHERVDYLGTSYLCSGAVCGNWWNRQKPAFQEFEPAFAVVELFADGSFGHSLHRVPIGRAGG